MSATGEVSWQPVGRFSWPLTPVDVHVMVEVSGCPTTCMHCWALGRSYRAMPIEDAAFFLGELFSFGAGHGLEYATYLMHEVTAHPAAPDMIVYGQPLSQSPRQAARLYS